MVNTFLPYKNFKKCAEALDNKRLFKQIVECKQILKAIEANKKKEKYGFQNHPIVKMWTGYEKALRKYQICMISEWLKRRWDISKNALKNEVGKVKNPKWLGDERLHKSHRLNLLFKYPEHYKQFFSEKGPSKKPEYYWCEDYLK